jgi:hypothetical protein
LLLIIIYTYSITTTNLIQFTKYQNVTKTHGYCKNLMDMVLIPVGAVLWHSPGVGLGWVVVGLGLWGWV